MIKVSGGNYPHYPCKGQVKVQLPNYVSILTILLYKYKYSQALKV